MTDAKRTILFRRARFVAAALAGTGVAASACDPPAPRVVAPAEPDGGAAVVHVEPPREAAAPTVLAPSASPPDADAGASQPCLSISTAPPPVAPRDAGRTRPMVCLSEY